MIKVFFLKRSDCLYCSSELGKEKEVLSCKLQAASCKLQAASCKLQAASCKQKKILDSLVVVKLVKRTFVYLTCVRLATSYLYFKTGALCSIS
ncbi:hypothetical protein QWZ13_10220 [Reinekea marina]|uniref:hypothetical protein n=1 Tax=Reinekea marina TaxID=1310421 RepID=UPI0025B33058|nr:hypothetical protein [Reinekea marina]MDN3649288.1 hypothetical protein [Reinekea marina]